MPNHEARGAGPPVSEISTETRLLADDPDAVGQVFRWIASVLTTPRFWLLRGEWSDLQQETMLRIIESVQQGRFDPTREFKSYVQGIARNTALQALEKNRRILPFADGQEERLVADLDSESQIVSVQLLRRTMDLLPDECRSLIRSYFLERETYTEIASSLGVPVGTVKSRLFRCLESACRIVQDRKNRPLRGLTGRPPLKLRTPEP